MYLFKFGVFDTVTLDLTLHSLFSLVTMPGIHSHVCAHYEMSEHNLHVSDVTLVIKPTNDSFTNQI